MKIGEAFPSKYLKASDLQGRHVRLQIDKVQLEDIGDDAAKPVVYFQSKQKGLVLNRTNAQTITDAYGDDTDHWRGAEVELFATKVLFQSRMVDAIRINIPPQQRAPAPPPMVQAPAGGGAKPHDDFSDDIPFNAPWQ